MMEKTSDAVFLKDMHFPVPEREILARLGYSRFRTQLETEERQKLLAEIGTLAGKCHPSGCWRIFPVQAVEQEGILLANGMRIASAKVAARYPDARHMWFGAVTIGGELPAWSNDAMKAGRSADALIADAVGGEMADGAMDFLQKQASAELLRRGLIAAKFRFSPGYGDWSLEGQQLFFDLLDMDALGVSLTPSKIMIPEKSVTAVAGVVCG